MYKLCKTEQSASRQKLLEDGLLTAMEHKRYEEITISDLCEQMDIPRKSFYRYFSSKDGALHALIDHNLMEFEYFAVQQAEIEHRSLRGDLKLFFLFWLQHRKLLNALDKSDLSGVLIERAISHALQDTVMPTRFLPDDSKEVQRQVTMFGVCGLMSMVLTWYRDGFIPDAEHMAQIATRLIGQPLFPKADQYM